ncbi:MAG: hypothetical protein HKN42_08425 [Granulosicoccus sp.]|nr:hypothetical protein [Granulosicoccus sp.]
MNQIMPLLALYSEFIAGLLLASVLSLFCGWMMHRSKARKRLQAVTENWEKKFQALDETARSDAENLEEQLQSLASEAKNLQSTNRVLTESLKKNDNSIQKARAEAIELNRQHAETQDRLQRIIQQKDREILELGNRGNSSGSAQGSAGSSFVGTSMAGNNAKGTTQHTDYGDLNDADTIAINSVEIFDATVQMPAHELLAKSGRDSSGRTSSEQRSAADDTDDTHESTSDLSDMDPVELEESTVALDEEALAFARRPTVSGRRD